MSADDPRQDDSRSEPESMPGPDGSASPDSAQVSSQPAPASPEPDHASSQSAPSSRHDAAPWGGAVQQDATQEDATQQDAGQQDTAHSRSEALRSEARQRQESTDSSRAQPVSREESWARLRAGLGWRPTRSQLLAGLLCALLAFAATTQIRQTEADGLQQLSEPELVRILGDVGERSDRLEAERSELESQRRELESGSGQREVAREQAQERADALAILTGEVAVQGSGISVVVTDPEGAVTAADFVGIIQELRDAGAEAIEIGGVRVVAQTAVTPSGRGVLVDGRPISTPYEIKAIGDPETMDTALQIPGGVRDTVDRRGASMTTERHDSLEITSTVAG